MYFFHWAEIYVNIRLLFEKFEIKFILTEGEGLLEPPLTFLIKGLCIELESTFCSSLVLLRSLSFVRSTLKYKCVLS